MNDRELKQKIRNLKKLEIRLRYGYSFECSSDPSMTKRLQNLNLVWGDFFGESNNKRKVKYPFHMLENKSKEELKSIFDEYWLLVYVKIYQERGIGMIDFHLTELLKYLELPLDSDKSTIKKKFRELAKVYHPDAGGDRRQFEELMDMMKNYQ